MITNIDIDALPSSSFRNRALSPAGAVALSHFRSTFDRMSPDQFRDAYAVFVENGDTALVEAMDAHQEGL